MLLDDIYKSYEEYHQKYGDKCIVFYQIGSFYEVYSKENIYPDLASISEILNIIFTRKDKSKDDSPYMLGFPCQMIHKYVRKLINQDYTVVLYKQVQNEFNKFDRILEAIYSPSTYTDDIQNQNNYMCGIYIERSGLVNLVNYHLSMTFIDVSTGEISFTEEHFNQIEYMLTFIHSIELETNPKEYILFYDEDNLPDIEKLLSQTITKKYTTAIVKERPLHYQTEFFKRIYHSPMRNSQGNIMHIFDYLDLSNYHISRQNILFTLEYCYSLNSSIINHIKKPKLYKQNSLILGNDAISQLNIIDNNNLSVLNHSFKSVYDVVNNCLTTIGKRFLFKKITKPSIKEDEISSFYNLSLEIFPVYNIISIILKKVKDIEKLGRKIMMGNVMPNELYNFYNSILEIHKLSAYDFKNLPSMFDFDLNSMFNKIIDFSNFMERYFYSDILNQYVSIKDIKNNFIKDSEIQNIIEALNKNKDVYEETVEKFIMILNEDEKSGKKTTKLEIKDSKDGKYISTTTTKADKIFNKLSNVDKEKYDYRKLNKIAKIYVNSTSYSTLDYTELQNKLNLLVRKKYYSIIEEMEPFFDTFYQWNTYIAIIDFCVNNCILKDKLGYCSPEFLKQTTSNSNLIIEDVRHPIIEKIIHTPYIPNSINMKDDKFIFLTGLNSAGKSSFKKSIAISIILAQSGIFVPARKMLYTPFEKLYVRITGSDNVFKGLSSFLVEMTELNTIIQNCGKNSMVIADELCHGTESVSALSILCATLKKLVDSNTTFIFSSHFHEVFHIDFLKNLNLNYYYLDVDVEDNGKLIFNRKLKKGKCEDLYGLKVAKSVISDTSFIKMSETVCREIKGLRKTILNDKKSRYNSNVYVDQCMICNSIKTDKLETHHIMEQQDCDKFKSKENPHIAKNSVGNLIVLCQKCHDDIHCKNVKIIKKETSNGIEIELKEN